MTIMGTGFSDEGKSLVDDELKRILNSKQFANAPIVRTFLEYVVNETVGGRGERIKAYTIAVEALGRSPEFDPSNDTTVRTTAGRVRKTLQAYYRSRETPPLVMISLPKGSYVPSFDVQDALPLPAPQASGRPLPVTRPFSRVGLLLATGIFAVIAIGLGTFFEWEAKTRSLSDNIVINVHPVEYVGDQSQSLAREIDIRLAPALSRIKLAEIMSPRASAYMDERASTVRNGAKNSTFFDLDASITNDAAPELIWKLTDVGSNHISWTSREPLSEMNTASIDTAVDKIAFEVLGGGGAVSSTLERYRGGIFSRPICLSRAQIMEVIENDAAYPEIHDCLERVVRSSPNDASAWAVLSTFYTLRSYFYSAGNGEERTRLVEQADRAAERAVELSPGSYLTKVALMHLSLRQRKVADFDALQQEIRKNYPGDIYLQIRIATRIARLGRSQEALEIFDRAQNDFGINLRNWAPGIAVAYFAEGEYEQAYHQMLRTTSDLRFVLVLKAAILGKLHRVDEAAPIVGKLVETNPDIQETLYPWLIDLGWAEPLVREIAEGLAQVGLVVTTHPSDTSMQHSSAQHGL